ncbi:divergent polysaccharide deacetylase family protein [Roseinatronobacter bogoriensis]|uniref:Divergent polysaccharide deacetylase family protein n=1 Tax=Roseinatronobacter bogoriensis subsp. barguzinensis TaxID=441209 RepID=A0A2K8K7J0_9RHOB|nr:MULTISPECIES: divergent polysaccharide deacetylase family protein [Rhodobaca]ATX65427.1 hypothetical protein BG454_05960 [Rhodobaca barguzinensis]MBB4209014.1 hypothetical protein [Rhodobaca bogoriensis DSM 18756]TDW37561.1 hypothetical protein LY39_02655 [Rhodobaca barguzinensis]TDY68171.1 hypothetical protein EV660_10676 [Rhodobaca bogoriensis DSM 18756]
MNSSLLAGLAVGAGVVVAGVIATTVMFPPVPTAQVSDSAAQQQAQPEAETVILQPPMEDQPAAPDDTPTVLGDGLIVEDATETPMPEDMATDDVATDDMATDDVAADDAVTDEPVSEDSAPEVAETVDLPETEVTTEDTDALADASESDVPLAEHRPEVDQDGAPATEALSEDGAPEAPGAEDQPERSSLPTAIASVPQADAGVGGDQFQPPAPIAPVDDAPEASIGPDADTSEEQLPEVELQAMPGMRVSGLPLIGEGSDAPIVVDQSPLPQVDQRPALLRNSLYQPGDSAGNKMAIILLDEGLPMPIRRDLAALEYPFTVALNPMDSSATEAAEIYHAAGKEVVILAADLPSGATASDLDVSLNAYFSALPLAVGVMDLPENGFARNAGLLREVLPVLGQDGHGLLTFAGGLTQAARASDAAGIAHSEIFRVLDAGNENAFTIRRFLDRAVFQAAQIGQVIVFGNASNEDTLEAIEMWREERRSGQVTLVPVSAILLQND